MDNESAQYIWITAVESHRARLAHNRFPFMSGDNWPPHILYSWVPQVMHIHDKMKWNLTTKDTNMHVAYFIIFWIRTLTKNIY